MNVLGESKFVGRVLTHIAAEQGVARVERSETRDARPSYETAGDGSQGKSTTSRAVKDTARAPGFRCALPGLRH